ncbi:MAG: hypothetical protein LUC25_07085 [Ruminococcus sp.]|nr:hypothetical protein [Ruminococcus sp.]
MSRNKKKPTYDSQQILSDMMTAAVEIYSKTKSLQKTANELDLNPIKIRKLLITANCYRSEIADNVQRLLEEKSVSEIMTITGLSKSSVNSYLPYAKPPYKAEELSVNAERIQLYRKRRAAVEKLTKTTTFENLWDAIILFEGYPFQISKGLKFTYTVHGGEMKISRKEKAVTRSSVEMAHKRALEGGVTGPKKMGVFGASYLYPVFVRLGVISM